MDPTSIQIKQFIVPAVCLLLSLLASGCNSSDSQAYLSCKNRLTSSWADPKVLHADIAALTSDAFEGRKTGTLGAQKSRNYIASRFNEIGLKPWQDEYAVPFSYQLSFSQRQGINMVGVIRAKQPTDKWRIVLAHYDHLGKKGNRIHPGADDNASGIAAMLQIASRVTQSIKAGDSQPSSLNTLPINYLFVATDAEEPGLFGGYALVESLKTLGVTPQIEQIELAINLDMVGRPGRPYAIYLEGKKGFKRFNEIQRNITAANGLCIKATHPRSLSKSVKKIDWLRASDHYPLHKAGIPWLYFGVPPHNDYHSTRDTIEKIDLQFLAAVTESANQLLVIDSLLLK